MAHSFRPSSSQGAIMATGRPWLVTIVLSPFPAAEMIAENFAFASLIPIGSMHVSSARSQTQQLYDKKVM